MKGTKLFNLLLLALLIQTCISKLLKSSPDEGPSGVFCNVESYSKTNLEFPNCYKSNASRMGFLAWNLALGLKGLVSKTTYSHNVFIDGQKGIYYSNCSCFVSYIVNHISPEAFQEIPKDKCVKPPAARATKWASYFADGAAAKGTSKFWEGIPFVKDAREGDVLSWGFSVDKKCKIQEGHHDTGHVMIITSGPKGEAPVTIDKDGKWAYLWVADASNVKHLKDTNFGARYSELTVFNTKNPGKTSGESKVSGIGLGQVKLGLLPDGKPNGHFVLQTKLVDDSKIGIGRAIGKAQTK